MVNSGSDGKREPTHKHTDKKEKKFKTFYLNNCKQRNFKFIPI